MLFALLFSPLPFFFCVTHIWDGFHRAVVGRLKQWGGPIGEGQASAPAKHLGPVSFTRCVLGKAENTEQQ